MRHFMSLVLVLALGVMGCSETAGTGGSAGDGGSGGVGDGGAAGTGGNAYPGNCGHQGQGGGGAWIYPGLYRPGWNDDSATYRACAYVNEDCTALEASTECNIGEGTSQANFLEVEWTDGRTEMGDECTAAVSLTPDMVPAIPIIGCNEWNCTSFRIEFSDEEGADWLIAGSWDYDTLFVYAERTTGDVVCRSHVGYPSDSDCLFAAGSEGVLCLVK